MQEWWQNPAAHTDQQAHPARVLCTSRARVWQELHLGVEDGFRPARKAHPGVLVTDLDALTRRLAAAGVETRPDGELPGYRRCYVDDPFGNRLEFLQPTT